MRDESLYESVPNFSEGRRLDVVAAIAGAAGIAHVLDADPDANHNRMVVSIAGFKPKVLDSLLASTAAAIETIDLRKHSGVHPRVGAADVLPIVPLGAATLAGAREVAMELGARIWSDLRVPVYFYGYGTDRSLADIRAGRARPDVGGPEPHPTAGAACVGARRPMVAFNVLLAGVDAVAARTLAGSLRESSGGLAGVKALVFELADRHVQLSMNLTRLEEVSPATVVAELERRGADVVAQELVGLSPATAANSAAAGKLLEGRLAAAAARAGARASWRTADAEHSRLAEKLEKEAGSLAATGIEQDELLAAAERSAALVPVLRAAGIVDPEVDSMLRIAAHGLREAISPSTRSRYPERIDALDRRLALV